MRFLWLAIIAFSIAGPAQADKYSACFRRAAQIYHLNACLLETVGKQESHLNPNAIHKNLDGSYDIGIMQLNTRTIRNIHDPRLTREAIFDPCTNIYVGAWILKQSIMRHGQTWSAVGYYNASSQEKRHLYEQIIASKYVKYCQSEGN